MPAIKYGKKEIVFSHEINDCLNDAYISVDTKEGVILKSPPISEDKAKELVRKKAAWIVKKLKLVHSPDQEEIVTGSRLPYLGKSLYTQIIVDDEIPEVKVFFDQSLIKIFINSAIENKDQAIRLALEEFYRNRAAERIVPRVKKWIKTTKLEPVDYKFRKLNKRWGSCTKDNVVLLNYDAVKLPYSIIDYIIVHELCHLRVKKHSKEFWSLVSRYVPNHKELEEKILGFKL